MLLETLGVGSFGKVKRTDLLGITNTFIHFHPRYVFIFSFRPDFHVWSRGEAEQRASFFLLLLVCSVKNNDEGGDVKIGSKKRVAWFKQRMITSTAVSFFFFHMLQQGKEGKRGKHNTTRLR